MRRDGRGGGALLASAAGALLACCAFGHDEPTRPAGDGPIEAVGRPVETLRARVVEVWPHDPQAFTQGLLWHDGLVFESTGRYGLSDLRAWELETGRVVRRVALPRQVWGEGLALAGDRLLQLTWKSGVAYVWSPGDFARVGDHAYQGEGWGLTWDGSRLVMSDGSATLSFRDPRTFAVDRTVEVRRGGRPVAWLNELEWARGAIWANVFTTDDIVRIDPASGEVTGVLDASGLLTEEDRWGVDVLNGIAYRPETDTFLLTGKLWPSVFEVVIEPAPR